MKRLGLACIALALAACGNKGSSGANVGFVAPALTKAQQERFDGTVDDIGRLTDAASKGGTSTERFESSLDDDRTSAIAQKVASCQFDGLKPATAMPSDINVDIKISGATCPLSGALLVKITPESLDSAHQKIRFEAKIDMNVTDPDFVALAQLERVSYQVKGQLEAKGQNINGTVVGGGEAVSTKDGKVVMTISGSLSGVAKSQFEPNVKGHQTVRVGYPDGMIAELKQVIDSSFKGPKVKCYLNGAEVTDKRCKEITKKLKLVDVSDLLDKDGHP